MNAHGKHLWVAAVLSALLSGCGDGAVTGTAPVAEQPSDPIAARIDRLFPPGAGSGSVDRDLVRQMMEMPAEEDGPFFMVNFIRFRERAEYPDGRETDLTGVEANQIYGGAVSPILAEIGARPVFLATVNASLEATAGEQFHQIAVVLYPSRAAFFGMLEREDFRAVAIHKVAGVERTLVMPAHLPEDMFPDALREVDLESVRFPPTDDDPPFQMAYLYQYRDKAVYADGRETDLTGREAAELYTQQRSSQGLFEIGVRPSWRLDIDGMLIGTGPVFHEFRGNLFPSWEAFQWVVAMNDTSGIEHRQAGLENVYTLVTAPVIDEYGYR